MGIISWIIFGAIAGWLAGLISGDENQGCLTNIIVGIVGAFLGGFLVEFFTGTGVYFHFTIKSFAVAVLGSVILLAIVRGARKR